MKIGITGGFGFVGKHLLTRLAKEQYQLVLLSNRNRDLPDDEQDIAIKSGMVEDVPSLIEAFKGCDTIIHLVGLIAETKTKTFDKTVVLGTGNVVTAAKKTGVKQLIYLSALGTNQQAGSRYHQTKYQAEQAIMNSGLNYTILRPSVIYGPGDGFISLLTKMINRSPITPVIGDGRYRLQPVFINDVTEALMQSISNESVKNTIITLAGPE